MKETLKGDEMLRAKQRETEGAQKTSSEAALRWDAHTCLPLHPNASLSPLLRYHRAGVRYLSVNVGMDMNPLSQVMQTLAGFRESVMQHPKLTLAGDLSSIRVAASDDLLNIAFDLEGSLPLLERPEMVALYRALGVRQIHLAYNRNNSASSGCHDRDEGLSALGVSFVHAMNRAGVIMDCAHMSVRASVEAVDASATPVVISHANPRTLVTHGRNATDEQLDAIADRGGVVCVSGVNAFLGEGDPTLKTVVDHICYIAERCGVEHVGVGLDVGFHEAGIDDTPPPPYDADYWWPPSAGYSEGIQEIKYIQPEAWSLLPQSLSERGMERSEIDAVLGENMARVLAEVERAADLSN